MRRRLATLLLALWSGGPGPSPSRTEEAGGGHSLSGRDSESASPEVARALEWLRKEARDLVRGARVMAGDGTPMYTADGKSNYRALWTRDSACRVMGAADFIPEKDIEACLRCLVRAVRADGAAPDRVRPDGRSRLQAPLRRAVPGSPARDN